MFNLKKKKKHKYLHCKTEALIDSLRIQLLGF